MDYVQALDPSKLTLGLTVLSFITAPFASPSYNLPILLFGILAQQQENADGTALQTFSAMLGGSAIFDIIWLSTHEQNWFTRLLTILLLILKVPTFIAFALALRQQRGSLGGFSGLSGIRGGDLGGATVWESMPGGFGSARNNGYQNVDEDPAPFVRTPTAPPPAPTAQPAAAAAPGAYQTV
ncbi:hypothetical protein FB45DRAFT_1028118 [Roridomyces roridus]|uniref:Uncharacterized protein n=1 Tax=Roridomyces roridus TaxID=1738132 RepID=A0AAD7BUD2_9AGAR|nr:hypothetical protein FB45DRAFT_1028118 [Roridomyces roridus]